MLNEHQIIVDIQKDNMLIFMSVSSQKLINYILINGVRNSIPLLPYDVQWQS